MKEPIEIKGPLPGEAVDKHLKMFGHLPTTEKCNDDGDCMNDFGDFSETCQVCGGKPINSESGLCAKCFTD